jgi:FecR protein
MNMGAVKRTSFVVLLLLNLLLPVSYAEATSVPVTDTAVTVPASTAPAETAVAPAKDAAPITEEKADKDTATKDSAKVEQRKEVAHVVWVKGSFYATMPGSDERRELKPSSKIYMNDTLITTAASEAQVVFSDNSLMAFRPETKFYINQYNYVPKTKAKQEKSVGTYVMDLLEGGFRTVTGLVAKDNPDNYQVNTPVATIGVRGTEYSVVYTKGGQLYIKRYKGIPCVSNKKAADKQKADTVCLNQKDKFAEVDGESGSPAVVAKEPNVFSVEVEIVPVMFSSNAVGYCGMSGCAPGEGGSNGFCVQ